MFVVVCVVAWCPCDGYPYPMLYRGFVQGMRLRVRSCLRELHARHRLCRLFRSWFGSPLPGGVMWSIVQSSPVSSLLQCWHVGSSIVLAYFLAARHSGLSCQSFICFF